MNEPKLQISTHKPLWGKWVRRDPREVLRGTGCHPGPGSHCPPGPCTLFSRYSLRWFLYTTKQPLKWFWPSERMFSLQSTESTSPPHLHYNSHHRHSLCSSSPTHQCYNQMQFKCKTAYMLVSVLQEGVCCNCFLLCEQKCNNSITQLSASLV